jgi:hypothetical protein
MIDLVTCNFPSINPKLGVTLPNLIESDKATQEQEIEGFHVAGSAQTLN